MGGEVVGVEGGVGVEGVGVEGVVRGYRCRQGSIFVVYLEVNRHDGGGGGSGGGGGGPCRHRVLR